MMRLFAKFGPDDEVDRPVTVLEGVMRFCREVPALISGYFSFVAQHGLSLSSLRSSWAVTLVTAHYLLLYSAGFRPGMEFKVALDEAEARDIPVVFGDSERDVRCCDECMALV